MLRLQVKVNMEIGDHIQLLSVIVFTSRTASVPPLEVPYLWVPVSTARGSVVNIFVILE